MAACSLCSTYCTTSCLCPGGRMLTNGSSPYCVPLLGLSSRTATTPCFPLISHPIDWLALSYTWPSIAASYTCPWKVPRGSGGKFAAQVSRKLNFRLLPSSSFKCMMPVTPLRLQYHCQSLLAHTEIPRFMPVTPPELNVCLCT